MATPENMMFKEWEKALRAITQSDKFNSDIEKVGYLSPESISFRKYIGNISHN
jgi:hypothetical protein